MTQLQQIIDGGYCIGCGGCDSASDGVISIAMDESGMYQADISSVDTLSNSTLGKALKACPFSDAGPNEDVIGEKLYGNDCAHDSRLGYYNNLYIGYVAENDFRAKGTSGGVITWVLTELLKRGEIDAVAHVKKVDSPEDGILFQYGLSLTEEEIMDGAKSRYYPVEMSQVLEQIKSTPGRYAVVGLPCFIKAIRRLSEIDPVIKERVVLCVGLVCGHLKSKAFADCFGWQVGIPPGELEEIDFRVKLPGRSAGDYGMYLRGTGKEVTKPTREFLGANWGYNFFRYPACNYCDDVFAEVADIAIGDAWLPEYEKDSKGTSVIVVRNEKIGAFVEAARKNGLLSFTASTSNQIAESQAGGLRDRREGLGYRLYLLQKQRRWFPCKRVKPSVAGMSRQRRRIYKVRSEIGAASHVIWGEALNREDYQMFESSMMAHIRKTQRLYSGFARRCVSAMKRLVIAVVEKDRL